MTKPNRIVPGVLGLALVALIIGLAAAWHEFRPQPPEPAAWRQANVFERGRMADAMAAHLRAEQPNPAQARAELGEPDHIDAPQTWYYAIGHFGPHAMHPGRHWLVVEFTPEGNQWRLASARPVLEAPRLSD